MVLECLVCGEAEVFFFLDEQQSSNISIHIKTSAALTRSFRKVGSGEQSGRTVAVFYCDNPIRATDCGGPTVELPSTFDHFQHGRKKKLNTGHTFPKARVWFLPPTVIRNSARLESMCLFSVMLCPPQEFTSAQNN